VKKVSAAVFWQSMFASTFVVNLVILIWSILRWVELKVVMWRSVWLLPLVLYLVVLAGCVLLFLWIWKGNAGRLLVFLETFPSESIQRVFSRYPIIPGMVFVGIVALIPYLKFTLRIGEVVKKSTQDPVLSMIVFYWVVWWLVLAAAGALKMAFKTSWAVGFASALVIMGMVYEVYLRSQAVSTYPFSMGWSEASRYYYGSLLFSESVYGLRLPLSSLHPSRYVLQSLPFFPLWSASLGLAASRFWQFFLWIALSGLSAVVIVWRAMGCARPSADWKDRFWIKALFAGWLFLFLLRMGVYYHLELMVFIPLLFVSSRHPWRSLAALILASAWAGISRVNWFPVPAMIAISVYLLEEKFSNSSGWRALLKYLALPAAWLAAGLLSAVAAQAAYIQLSGNAENAQAFTSSFSSALLWERLWPNESYPLGIVPAVLIVSGPLIITLAIASVGKFKALHPIRWAGLWGMLVVLFAGGLVVSVKIGGGGDLHNMDAFAVLLSIVTAYFLLGTARSEQDQAGNGQAFSWPVAAIGLLIPLIFLILQLAPMPKYNRDANEQAFMLLKGLAEQAGKNGPVLFINERHLLTFHQIDLPLVPEYENVTLMEMAMSNNQVYLQNFYAELKSHRFSAIVAGKQNIGIKEEGAFAEENNIWNLRVSPYILCYYEPVVITTTPELLTYIEADESRIEFYLPRAEPESCP